MKSNLLIYSYAVHDSRRVLLVCSVDSSQSQQLLMMQEFLLCLTFYHFLLSFLRLQFYSENASRVSCRTQPQMPCTDQKCRRVGLPTNHTAVIWKQGPTLPQWFLQPKSKPNESAIFVIHRSVRVSEICRRQKPRKGVLLGYFGSIMLAIFVYEVRDFESRSTHEVTPNKIEKSYFGRAVNFYVLVAFLLSLKWISLTRFMCALTLWVSPLFIRPTPGFPVYLQLPCKKHQTPLN